MERRKQLLSLAVVGLLFLSGCSIPFTQSQTTPTNVENESDISYPYGWNNQGVTANITGDENPLLQESSLTIEFNRTISLAPNGTTDYTVEQNTSQIHRVSGAQQQWLITERQQDVETEYYYTSEQEYQRTAVLYENGSVQSQTVSQSPRQFDRYLAYQLSGSEMFALGTEYETVEVVTRNNTDFLRYTATGTEPLASNSPAYQLGTNSNLDGYSSTLLANKETGEIKSLTATVNGNRGNEEFKATFSFTYQNQSATTVPQPTWVTEILNQGEPSNELTNASNTSNQNNT